jgi:parvulin-like peptidyl-prolyl isomerase
MQRFTLIGGIIVIVAILAVVGTGLFMNKFRPLQAVVVKVENKEYTLDYLIKTMTGMGISQSDPAYAQIYTNYAVQQIEQNQLLVEAAARLENPITVSDSEVNKYIQDNKLSSDQSRKDAVRAQLLVNKLKSDYFGNQVPDSAEQRSVWAMFLSSQSQVDEIKARLDKGEKFPDIAAKFSLEQTSKDKKGEFNWVPKGVLPTVLGNATDTALDDRVFASDTQKGVLTSVEDKDKAQNVGYWLLQVVDKRVNPTPTPAPSAAPDSTAASDAANTQVRLNAMLVETKDLANQLKTRLTAGAPGDDFATQAKANSLYTGAAANGGDLGWVSKGDMGAAIDNVLFPDNSAQALAKNKISDPVQNSRQGGFWLEQVNGIENQKISDDNRTILVNAAVDKWFNQVWTDNKDKIQNLLTEEQSTLAFNEAKKR